MSTLLSEFKLKEYVDYEIQFQKTFLGPMRFILDAINWKTGAVAEQFGEFLWINYAKKYGVIYADSLVI